MGLMNLPAINQEALSDPERLKRIETALFQIIKQLKYFQTSVDTDNLNSGLRQSVSTISGKVDETTFQSSIVQLANQISASVSDLSEDIEDVDGKKYDKITGLTITPGLVEFVSLAVAFITAQLYISDTENPEDATLLVDTIEKAIKAQNVQSSGITLNGNLYGSNNVMLTTSLTSITVNPGQNIQDVISSFGKYITDQIEITVSNGIYSGFSVSGFKGGRIKLIFGTDVSITSGITISDCDFVEFSGNSSSRAQIIASSTNTHAIYCFNSVVMLSYLRITGSSRTSATTGTSNGVYCEGGTKLFLIQSIIEKTKDVAIYVDWGCVAWIEKCIGGISGGDYTTLANLGRGIVNNHGGIVTIYDTIPIGNTSSTETWVGPAISGTATPTASSGTPVTPTAYDVSYECDSTAFCALPTTATMGTAASSWSTGTVYPRGGKYSTTNKRYAGMWLMKRVGGSVENILTLLSGKTILSAALTLHISYAPTPTSHSLYYMKVNTLPPDGSTPASRLTDTGIDFTPSGTDITINLTDWLQDTVDSSTAFYGFGIGTTPGYYARFTNDAEFAITYQ